MKIDAREKNERIAVAKQYFPGATVGVLDAGDYVEGNMGVEYKDDDFVDSIGGHLFQQLDDLQQNFNTPVLIIAKSASQIRNQMRRDDWPDPYAGFNGVIASLITRGITPLFIEQEEWAFQLMQKLAVKANDGRDRRPETAIRGVGGVPRDATPSPKMMNRQPKKPGKRVPTIAEYQLAVMCGYPNMSIIRAKNIIKEFRSLDAFFNAEVKDIKKRVHGVDSLADEWKKLQSWERPEPVDSNMEVEMIDLV